MSKYHKLEEFLRKSQRQVETLSYNKIRKILECELPPSAYKYKAWWANSGDSQANNWLNAGWRVLTIELGSFIKFGKAERTKTQKKNTLIPKSRTSGIRSVLNNQDIPKIIKELHQLKTEGIITAEEFEEKKIHLLSIL